MSPGAWDPRARFAEQVRLPDARIELARAALWLAAEEYPGLDVERCLARLDELAARAAVQVGATGADAERAARLLHFLHRDEGFVGNESSYGDPRNSFLNEVLERRTGIPITLSLVLMEVARRMGLRLAGVSFPGHFLVKLDGPVPCVLDAFHGRVLDLAECRERLAAAMGAAVSFDAVRDLRAASAREILVRMLTNLKHLYLRARDFPRTLGCCERILLLEPEAPHELRDRGLVFEQLECFAAAAADLDRFLALAPGDPTAPAVRERLLRLRARPHRLH